MEVPERYFDFKSGTIDYTITSLGHDVGLKAEYPKSSLKKYVIKLRKSNNKMMKSQYLISVKSKIARLTMRSQNALDVV